MMKAFIVLTAILGLAVPISASAQMSHTTVVASNGMRVDIGKDAFAGRREFKSVTTPIEANGGQRGDFFVASVSDTDLAPKISIQGTVLYRGGWHYYDSAVFKGGEAVEFVNTDRDVLSCRYSCSYSERFVIFPTPDQVRRYAEGVLLPIQVRGQNSAHTFMLQVPVSLIAAINEVAQVGENVATPLDDVIAAGRGTGVAR